MEPVVSLNSISFDCPYCNGKGVIKKIFGLKKTICTKCNGRKRIVKYFPIKRTIKSTTL